MIPPVPLITVDNIFPTPGKLRIDVSVINHSYFVIENGKCWISVNSLDHDNDYFSTETKPKTFTLLSGKAKGFEFTVSSPNLLPDHSYKITAYFDTGTGILKATSITKIPAVHCTASDFQSQKVSTSDVTDIVKEFEPDIKTATLYVYHRMGWIVNLPSMPSKKELYKMWKERKTVEKRFCPKDGVVYYVEFPASLVITKKNEYPNPRYNRFNGWKPNIKLTSHIPQKVKPFGKEDEIGFENDNHIYYIIGAVTVGILLILLMRR